MAEIVLKIGTVGPDPAYQDGDIIAAFNQRRIRCTHAQHITHVKNFGLTRDGLRPNNTLAQFDKETTCLYRFERVSRLEVLRTNLVTLAEDTYSNIPNGEGHHIFVQAHVNQMKASPNHHVFGTRGREVWYGGKVDRSNSKMDAIWAEIEATTPNLEADFTQWPLGVRDKQAHLALSVDDFTDAESEALVACQKVPVGVDPVLGGTLFDVGKKRNQNVTWITLNLPETPANIRNKGREVDIRHVTFQRAIIVEVKPSG